MVPSIAIALVRDKFIMCNPERIPVHWFYFLLCELDNLDFPLQPEREIQSQDLNVRKLKG